MEEEMNTCLRLKFFADLWVVRNEQRLTLHLGY